MNGKHARQLRRIAYAIPDLPDVEYEEINVQEGPKLYIGPEGPAISKPIRTSTVQLVPHCRKAWYKSMKRAFKNEPKGTETED